MRISILPKTSLGRWSVGLAAAFILLFVLSGVLTGLCEPRFGVQLGNTITDQVNLNNRFIRLLE